MARVDGTIGSISQAVDRIGKLRVGRFVTSARWQFYKFPFGIWFRGHGRRGLPLIPRVHRYERIVTGRTQRGSWDETNVFEHLRVRTPGRPGDRRSAFDWLCLMQHYSVPTRLLDWTESLLVALYFAVKDDPHRTGELIVLNAGQLNRERDRPTLSPPDEGPVVVRSEMAWTRSSSKLRRRKTIQTALEEMDLAGAGDDWLKHFRTPLAVFPSRSNDRMVFQASVFTLHGGKQYPRGMKEFYDQGEIIPSPRTIDYLDRQDPSDCLLRRFLINAKAKRHILRDLSLLGIHEGTLFPEIDRQAVYLEDLWWYRDRDNRVPPNSP